MISKVILKTFCGLGCGEWGGHFRKFSRKVDGNLWKGNGTVVMEDKKSLIKGILNNFEIYLTWQVNGRENVKRKYVQCA